MTSRPTESGADQPGGRPVGFDKARYRRRNTVERGFCQLKHWRGLAWPYVDTTSEHSTWPPYSPGFHDRSDTP
ncbi:transposase [Pseudonocardia sp. KRD-184]|uniref:Transposase n=1 Tax=Pseudonocardia oceani TaxID=2792013 RepID=A0ABS6U8N8_9PSEU|nr:transposase [Pseudonocardia oceani]MBW0095952.1 transposase [Pseudonocardia oceani]MBW0108635.1 transposase [Pseudonocardia oceani]MBW0122763.1 transposase [Pseudonocardia oceani]MBW0128605.1 transposase [Pseudonocardia oceani]